MRLVIKFACVADGVNLRVWEPVDRKTIAEFIYLEIGEKGTKKSDEFTIRVATPQGLKNISANEGIIAERPLVIMDEYNFSELWKWLECIVSSCEGDTWLQCVEYLRRYFDWEYDNYKHN
ncbi:hypothetical protein FHD46_20410 [Escherichia coli]|nr:hypothetical protein [Escherichia coli]